jgi:hypothetical protein
MRSRATLFGHPIHPMVVGFPIVLYVATLAALVVYAGLRDPFWLRLARLANGVALVAATAAVVPGLIDFLGAVPSGGAARRTARLHAGANVVALTLFAVCYLVIEMGGRGWVGAPQNLRGGPVMWTQVAGFHCWSLVQDHHIGIAPRRVGEFPPGVPAEMVATQAFEQMRALDEVSAFERQRSSQIHHHVQHPDAH